MVIEKRLSSSHDLINYVHFSAHLGSTSTITLVPNLQIAIPFNILTLLISICSSFIMHFVACLVLPMYSCKLTSLYLGQGDIFRWFLICNTLIDNIQFKLPTNICTFNSFDVCIYMLTSITRLFGYCIVVCSP